MIVLPPPLLEVFYSSTCAPCRLELPAVAEFARRDGVRVRIAIIGNAERARLEIARVSPSLIPLSLTEIREPPRAALRRAGDADAILPYARVLTANSAICARWRGMLTLERARALIRACTRTLSAPPSR